jgi:hypothetical protein
MAPARQLFACVLVLALCALAPHSADAAKKKRTAVGLPRGFRSLAPAPAPIAAMLRGRALLAGALQPRFGSPNVCCITHRTGQLRCRGG